jgi:hypothetical protein
VVQQIRPRRRFPRFHDRWRGHGSSSARSRTVVDPRELEALVDRTMLAEMKRLDIPGAIFIFVQNGRVVLEKGYGVADVARSKPVDPAKTIFPIASITKLCTAACGPRQARSRRRRVNDDGTPQMWASAGSKCHRCTFARDDAEISQGVRTVGRREALSVAATTRLQRRRGG